VAKPEKFQIASVQPVGRYALGINWKDQHESIFPFANLRRFCPCNDCRRADVAKGEPADAQKKLDSVQRIGDASVMLAWTDGHETLYLLEELRELCGCAHCKGEPNYPITGQ